MILRSRIPGGMALLGVLVAGGACDAEAERDLVIRFAARVGEQPFACGQTYPGMGRSASTIEPLDFRMYVHDVALISASGERVPLELEQDGRWQRDTLALLDFEDGSGACTTGNPELRTEIRGSVREGTYTGVEFTIGVPEELNQLDASTSPHPLNVQGLWWSWVGGYKFVRLDVATPSNPAFYFHLGATSCEGTPATGYACNHANLQTIRIDGFDVDVDVVAFDVAALYADSDLDVAPDPAVDSASGCMAFSGDPECPPMFERLGMRFESAEPGPPQTVFRKL